MDLNQENHSNPAREIRKEFFAFRNGIVADKLRKAGDPHHIIMGCLLVDIQAIAQRQREALDSNSRLAELAEELWQDTQSRECRLAAPMLYPPQSMTLEHALRWCETVETVEVADNLCHKLLRHIPEAEGLFQRLIAVEQPLMRYTGYRLLLNLLLLCKVRPNDALKRTVEAEARQAEQPLASLLNDILEEFNQPN